MIVAVITHSRYLVPFFGQLLRFIGYAIIF